MSKTAFLTLFVLAGCLFGQTNDPRQANIEVILERTGVSEQLKQFQPLLEQQLMSERGRMDQARFDAVAGILIKNVTPENILEVLRKNLLDNYNEAYVSNVIAFHDSPLAREFVRMEIEASGDREFEAKIRKFKMKTADPERKRLVEKLYKDLEMEAFSADLAAACVSSLLTAINSGLRDDEKLTPGEIEARSGLYRKILSANAGKTGIVSLMLTYQEAGIDEIRQYDEFYISPAGLWLEKIIKDSLIGGYSVCSEKAGKAIADYIDYGTTR